MATCMEGAERPADLHELGIYIACFLITLHIVDYADSAEAPNVSDAVGNKHSYTALHRLQIACNILR